MADSDVSPLEEGPPADINSRRHSAREVALQVLYAFDLGTLEAEVIVGEEADEPRILDAAERAARAFDRVAENFVVPASAVEFARELVTAVVDQSEELDALLGVHAKNWRVSRMAAVDRNVLRMAACELRGTATPVAVVIDEAVDLARRFGSDSSPAFVNGVLDAIAKEVRVT